MSPTASPTYCGKASKSWYYDDDYTSSGSGSGKSGKSTSGSSGSSGSGKSGKSSDCHTGARTTKSGKAGSGSGSGSSSSSDDQWRRGKAATLNVRRREIRVRD